MESGHHGQVLPVEKEHFLNGIQVALGVAAKVSHLRSASPACGPILAGSRKRGKQYNPGSL
jgi:hypothetical protein